MKNNIRELRNSLNLTQSELAIKVGVSKNTVSAWETGNSYPSFKHSVALTDVFGCSLNDIFVFSTH